MAEYWKSTPKYWCKYCKVYVRDTPFERKQHEATGRHQGGIQKSLRDLHRGKEQEQREKDRAKNEVARLTGIVSGKSTGSATNAGAGAAQASAPERKVATTEDRKRQAAQLAAMGIAVPQEFRADAAMKGEWQTVAIHAIDRSLPGDLKDEDEKKPDSKSIVKGVRKRKVEEDEEEDIGARSRPRWGHDTKTYRGREDEVDLESLLQESIALKQDSIKQEAAPETSYDVEAIDDQQNTLIESEAPVDAKFDDDAVAAETPVTGVIFKKRKAKQIRER